MKIRNLLILSAPICILLSCGPAGDKKTTVDKSQFLGSTLTVDISTKNTLAILMAKDGTINRARSGIVDSTDKGFFMGITQDKLFDSLMETVSDDLLSYCNKVSPVCDTTKQTCKVTVSFAGNNTEMGFGYCINGTLNDLPKPIKEYIDNAIRITEPWYQAQKSQILDRHK